MTATFDILSKQQVEAAILKRLPFAARCKGDRDFINRVFLETRNQYGNTCHHIVATSNGYVMEPHGRPGHTPWEFFWDSFYFEDKNVALMTKLRIT